MGCVVPSDSPRAFRPRVVAIHIDEERVPVSATKEHGVFIETTKTDRFRLVSLTDQATQSLIALRRAVSGRDKHRSAVRPRVRERIESCVAVAS